MNVSCESDRTKRYSRIVESSKRVRWEIDRDVFRNRRLSVEHKFLPDGLSLVGRLGDLSAEEGRLHCDVLSAYRFQYISSGVQRTRFAEVLMEMLQPNQRERVTRALAPFMA